MKKLLLVSLMAIVAIVCLSCSKNPTNSDSGNKGALTVIKNNAFGDRTSINPTNPGNSGPNDNSVTGIGVIIGSFVVSSDVVRRVSQITLQDYDAGTLMGRDFKNLFLMFVASDGPYSMANMAAQQFGDTIVNPNVLSVGKYVFTLSPIHTLRLMPGTRYTINVYADCIHDYVVSTPTLSNIKMNGIKFYSVTASEDGGPVNGPEVEYVSPLELQKIYIVGRG